MMHAALSRPEPAASGFDGAPYHGTAPTLHARGLTKRYRGDVAVEDATLSVDRGEIVGLLGPNGAGKTTCFGMIAGLVVSDDGQILLNGIDVTDRPVHVRARLGLGYLPQESSVFRRLTVADNVLAILEHRRDLSRQQRARRLSELLGELRLAHLADRGADRLSGGERRRVEIARALAAEPSIILLDEPFNAVDPITELDIQRMIRDLSARGIGILITDHRVRATLSICDRALILSGGRIIASGTPSELAANEQVRQSYLGPGFSL